MAEAAIEERSLRFFCHVCNVEVQSVSSEYTCPLCSGGFIEELPAITSSASADSSITNDVEMDDLDFLATLTSFLSRDNNRSQALLNVGENSQGTYSSNLRNTFDVDPNDSENISTENVNSFSSTVGSRHGRGNINIDPIGGRRTRRGRLPNFERFDNVLLEILHTLSGGSEGSLGNTSMFFMGNPGDYAWGREGIDTIVTQLLNQMDTTGPPPLPREKIDEIPKIEITSEQVNIKLQCSVCWEDFKLSETVRKLPCFHLYHENCIVPWLELHGTCPICRKNLILEIKESANNLRSSAANISFLSGSERTSDLSINEELETSDNRNNSNSPYNLNTLSGRRLHISLPRFALFSQSDTSRESTNATNFDTGINESNLNSAARQEQLMLDLQSANSSLESKPTTEQQNDASKTKIVSASTNKLEDEKRKSSSTSSDNNFKNLATNSSNVDSAQNYNTTATTSSMSSQPTVNNASSPDVFKFDDGQVDYEFD